MTLTHPEDAGAHELGTCLTFLGILDLSAMRNFVYCFHAYRGLGCNLGIKKLVLGRIKPIGKGSLEKFHEVIGLLAAHKYSKYFYLNASVGST